MSRAQTISGEQSQQPAEQEADCCPECDGDVVRDGREDVCSDCGLVVDVDDIDLGPEWKNYEDYDGSVARANGNPISPAIHDRGLGSCVGYGVGGKWRLDGDKNRIQLWNNRTRSGTGSDRTLRYGLSEIWRVVAALELPGAVRERASVIFRELQDADLIQGRSLDHAAGVSVLIGAREYDVTLRPGQLADIVRCPEDDVERSLLRYLRVAKRELDLHVIGSTPDDHVPSCCSDVGASREAKRLAWELVDELQSSGESVGGSPSCVAGGAVYAASRLLGEHVTQDDVAESLGTSRNSIRKWYRKALEVHGGESA